MANLRWFFWIMTYKMKYFRGCSSEQQRGQLILGELYLCHVVTTNWPTVRSAFGS
jgi:hypothetical protein